MYDELRVWPWKAADTLLCSVWQEARSGLQLPASQDKGTLEAPLSSPSSQETDTQDVTAIC